MKAIGTLFIGLSLLSMLIGGTLIYVLAIIVIAKLVHLGITKSSMKGNKKTSPPTNPPIHRKEPRKEPNYVSPRNNRKPVV